MYISRQASAEDSINLKKMQVYTIIRWGGVSIICQHQYREKKKTYKQIINLTLGMVVCPSHHKR